MKILIIANGQPAAFSQVNGLIKNADYIIAADGGMQYCLKNNIEADCLIGDMDSNDFSADNLPSKTKIVHITEQVSTDMEKALKYAVDLKPQQIDVIAAFGKRMDHTLGNMLILHNFESSIPLTMYDDFGKMQVLYPGENVLNPKEETTVSLFVLTQVKNIKLSGFRYPLDEKCLGPVFIGVSNIVEKSPAVVSFTNGRVLLYEVF